ncbi:MAG TPA: hypothetical protein VGC86_11240 [Afipia sp.]
MKHIEPPACEETPSRNTSVVLIGKNGRGQWVARERSGLYGGLFIDRISAMRYALFENCHHPEAIIPVPFVLELDISRAHQRQRK